MLIEKLSQNNCNCKLAISVFVELAQGNFPQGLTSYHLRICKIAVCDFDFASHRLYKNVNQLIRNTDTSY